MTGNTIVDSGIKSGVIRYSNRLDYHIFGEDGIAYAIYPANVCELKEDFGVCSRGLPGKRVQFTPSDKRNDHGLPYADGVIGTM